PHTIISPEGSDCLGLWRIKAAVHSCTRTQNDPAKRYCLAHAILHPEDHAHLDISKDHCKTHYPSNSSQDPICDNRSTSRTDRTAGPETTPPPATLPSTLPPSTPSLSGD